MSSTKLETTSEYMLHKIENATINISIFVQQYKMKWNCTEENYSITCSWLSFHRFAMIKFQSEMIYYDYEHKCKGVRDLGSGLICLIL